MTEENIEKIKQMVGAVLATDRPTQERIEELIQKVRKIYPITDEDAKGLVRHFETVHGVSMNIGAILPGEDFEPWLDAMLPNIDPYYWTRYRKFLSQKNLSHQVLATIDDSTQRILDHLENPQKVGKWQRRGMVVGHVQSGKTANYIGLICKAADAGYKVIVVIAGIHNNLRNQTQIRIDEGFIGFDSTKSFEKESKIVGVGRFDRTRRPVSFTNSLIDFQRTTAIAVSGIPIDQAEPVVFVIKKNANTLKNLLEWLTENNAKIDTMTVDHPMLLIDDEADNASINIKRGIDEVSKINGQIRQLLQTFSRSCYVGYTATPFANIFIDPDSDDAMFGEDLFPRDFILSLDPPSNYFGPQQVFLNYEVGESTDVNEPTRIIDDHEDIFPINHKIDFPVIELPGSLKKAIRAFVIVISIRLVRGQTSMHNSMLVNASRFVSVQRQLRNEIHESVEDVRVSLRVNGEKPNNEAMLDPEIAELYDIFEQEFAEICSCTWEEIKPHLYEGAARIRVVEVNSNSPGSLNYAEHSQNGFNVIAVGGFSLSRGLTLEGLSISYYLRRSIMYDTLMQMGRWFGYREGYEDLCRIWISEEAAGWYSHISESIEELREDLKSMERVGATPRQFGLKVRSHPTSLIVTARNKMGSSRSHVVQLGLSAKLIETYALSSKREDLDANRNAVTDLIQTLEKLDKYPQKILKNTTEKSESRMAVDVPVSTVTDFLLHFQNHKESQLTDTQPIRQYIEKHSQNRLSVWDVLFPIVKTNDKLPLIDQKLLGIEITCQRRKKGRAELKDGFLIGNNRKVATGGIDIFGLSEAEVKEAEELFRKSDSRGRNGKSVSKCPDRFYRKVRMKPLLVIHLLKIGEENQQPEYDKPVIAWSISFPRIENEQRVEYLVNTTWSHQHYLLEDEKEVEGDE